MFFFRRLSEEFDQEPQEQEEERYTEAEWIERWNDQFSTDLYLDAASDEEPHDDEFFVEDDDEDYDRGGRGGLAAIDGSGG